jgi:hypothetical protein
MGELVIRYSQKAAGGTRLHYIGEKFHTSVLKGKENMNGPMLRFIF